MYTIISQLLQMMIKKKIHKLYLQLITKLKFTVFIQKINFVTLHYNIKP